ARNTTAMPPRPISRSKTYCDDSAAVTVSNASMGGDGGWVRLTYGCRSDAPAGNFLNGYGSTKAMNRTDFPPRFWIRQVGSFGSRIVPPIHGPRPRVASAWATSSVSRAISHALFVGAPGLTIAFGGIVTRLTRRLAVANAECSVAPMNVALRCDARRQSSGLSASAASHRLRTAV